MHVSSLFAGNFLHLWTHSTYFWTWARCNHALLVIRAQKSDRKRMESSGTSSREHIVRKKGIERPCQGGIDEVNFELCAIQLWQRLGLGIWVEKKFVHDFWAQIPMGIRRRCLRQWIYRWWNVALTLAKDRRHVIFTEPIHRLPNWNDWLEEKKKHWPDNKSGIEPKFPRKCVRTIQWAIKMPVCERQWALRLNSTPTHSRTWNPIDLVQSNNNNNSKSSRFSGIFFDISSSCRSMTFVIRINETLI